MVNTVGLKKKKKKPQTIEGERTPEEREEIVETKTIAERAAQFQEEKRRQEAADPLLTAPSTALRGGTVELPDGRVFSGLSPQEVGKIQQQQGLQGGVVGTGLQGGVVGTPEQQQEAQQLEPSLIERQFEAEGGFEELEGRGERVVERIAELGLTPSVMIGEGIEKLTGKELSNKTAADMAETNFGKALGITIAGASGVALIGVAGAAIAAAVSGTVSTIATTLGVSRGAVAGATLVGGAGVTGLNKDIIVDKILDRKGASEIKGAVNTVGQMTSTIVGTHASKGISTSRALAELTKLDDNLNILEHELQQAAILDPRVKQSGDWIDIMGDLQDQKSIIREGRADVLNTAPEYDPAIISFYIDELQKTEKEKRQDLIDQGFLKETL